MTEVTEGVVLLTTPYNDTSSIVNILTAHYGRLSFLLSNSRSSKSAVKRTHFQPLNRLEIVISIKQGYQIHRIKESRLLSHYTSLQTNPSKRLIALFLSEVLHRIIRNEEHEYEMYDFVVDSIQILDLSEDRYENFHLLFLSGIIRILGFLPQVHQYTIGDLFDLLQGEFVKSSTSNTISPSDSQLLYIVISHSFTNMSDMCFSRDQRNRVLDLLLEYIRKHIHPGIQFKSLEVLRVL